MSVNIDDQRNLQESQDFPQPPQTITISRRQPFPSDTLRLKYHNHIKQTTLHLRSQPTSVNRNRIIYSTKNIQARKITDLFENVFQKIHSNRTRKGKKNGLEFGMMGREQGEKIRMPNEIVDCLYRQNINNYNPFIATLQALQEQEEMSTLEKERISKLCHIGVAKQFLKTKKYAIGPRYSRVNVQIRPYMRQKMHEQVKQKQQNYQNVVFIPTNQLALSFNPYHYPPQLQDSLSSEQFSSIISHVNNLIEKQYVSYKQSGMFSVQEGLVGRVLLGFLAFFFVLLFVIPIKQLLTVICGVILLWIIMSVVECGKELDKLVRSKNVTNTIQEKIKGFFQKINTEQTQWRVGQDFYWLQIHFIKKKKPQNMK